ncbi:MAG: esterase/lipase family protein [Terrimicrobiaceae bacterium]
MGSAIPQSTSESEAHNPMGSKFGNDGPAGDPGSGTASSRTEPETFQAAFEIQSSGKQVKNNCAVCHWLEVQIDGDTYETGQVATLLKGKSYEITVKDSPRPLPPNAFVPKLHPNVFDAKFTVYPMAVDGQTIRELPGGENQPPLAFIAQKDEVFQYLIDNSEGLLVRDKEWPKNAADEPMNKKGLFVPMDIAVDANRDGTIRFAGNSRSSDTDLAGKPLDKTTPEAPFRFWCNDDDDFSIGMGGAETGDHVPVQRCDFDDAGGVGVIDGKRDLEDFTRLSIYLGGLQDAITAGKIQVGLKWKNAGATPPSINVYRSAAVDGSDSYLRTEAGALAQMQDGFAAAKIKVEGTTAAVLPSNEDVWTGLSQDSPSKYFLFEGATEGKGQLCITIHDSEGHEIGEGPGVWLDLKDIKKMLQRGNALPEGIQAPHDNESGPFSGTISVDLDGDFQKDLSEEKNAIVFVHGWSMTYDSYINYSETMFKRLWHQGFKGRFCSLRWAPLVVNEAQLYAGEYNRSEHRAFLYGQALKQFVETVKQDIPTVSLIGHSMGNIVCGSALQQGLMVNNYLLMEAAVPAGCFDESGGNGIGGVNGYARFWNLEVTNPTPDYHQAPNGDQNNGYRGFLQVIGGNVAGDIVNYHNQRDFALATGTKFFFFEANWEKNQEDYKPDGSTTVIHSGDWRYLYNSNATDLSQRARLENIQFINSSPVWALTRYVNNSFEVKSFIARPRSMAVGSTDASLENQPGIMRHVNLQDYGFDGRESDHSGQFNRRIQELDALYLNIFTTVQPPE